MPSVENWPVQVFNDRSAERSIFLSSSLSLPFSPYAYGRQSGQTQTKRNGAKINLPKRRSHEVSINLAPGKKHAMPSTLCMNFPSYMNHALHIHISCVLKVENFRRESGELGRPICEPQPSSFFRANVIQHSWKARIEIYLFGLYFENLFDLCHLMCERKKKKTNKNKKSTQFAR